MNNYMSKEMERLLKVEREKIYSDNPEYQNFVNKVNKIYDYINAGNTYNEFLNVTQIVFMYRMAQSENNSYMMHELSKYADRRKQQLNNLDNSAEGLDDLRNAVISTAVDDLISVFRGKNIEKSYIYQWFKYDFNRFAPSIDVDKVIEVCKIRAKYLDFKYLVGCKKCKRNKCIHCSQDHWELDRWYCEKKDYTHVNKTNLETLSLTGVV